MTANAASKSTGSTSSTDIAERIVDALMAQRLAPGARLGEQRLADLFGVSRTLVREAMMRLAGRGIVKVNARRGWFIAHPSPTEVFEAFEARRIIETGLLRNSIERLDDAGVQRLREHLASEQHAIERGEVDRRSWLLGDFHVCLAEALGNSLLAEILRDLTARTQIMAMLRQSSAEAHDSCDEHHAIVDALAARDIERAVALMNSHLSHIRDELEEGDAIDPLDAMRQSLAPLGPPPGRRSGAAPAVPVAVKALKKTSTSKDRS